MMRVVVGAAATMMTFAMFSCTAVVSDDDRPNILLLLTDDQDVLLGGTKHMPFFDHHLTQQGTTLENFFVHTPICCPSRTSILSGRYIHNGGALNNSFDGNCGGRQWRNDAEQLTFAVYAQQAGYKTGFSGKYLNTYGLGRSNKVPPGWDRWLGLVGNSAYYDYNVVVSDDGVNATRRRHGGNYSDDYFPDLVANRTLQMMEEFASPTNTSSTARQPFLIVCSWPTPHGPFTPAPWALHLYNQSRAPRTPNWNASDKFMQQKHWIMRQQSPISVALEEKIDKTHQRRVQSLQSVDRHIDQFIRLLKTLNVLDNTIIMYTSDNGFQAGQHRLAGDKRHLYEHDIRVPFVIRGPNIPKNVSIFDQIALNIDIAPTIYQIVHNHTTTSNQDTTTTTLLPDTMDGVSILPISKDGMLAQRQGFLISYFGEGYRPCDLMVCPPNPPDDFHIIDATNNTFHCIRSIVPNASDVTRNSWKNFTYCRFEDDEKFGEYYDHTTDPWQLQNKFLELSRDVQAELDYRLAALRRCRGDECRALMGPLTPVPPSSQEQTSGTAGRLWRHTLTMMSCSLALSIAHTMI